MCEKNGLNFPWAKQKEGGDEEKEVAGATASWSSTSEHGRATDEPEDAQGDMVGKKAYLLEDYYTLLKFIAEAYDTSGARVLWDTLAVTRGSLQPLGTITCVVVGRVNLSTF